MTWLHIFIGFFTANILGYGGGPSTIPLMQAQIVSHYHWMNNAQFTDILAIANALPGPVATKIAAAVGYQMGGWLGVIVALAATVIPSAIAIIVLLRVLQRFRKSTVVKGMTLLIQPVIAVLMILLTVEVMGDASTSVGWIETIVIGVVAWYVIQRRKVHPAFVIAGAFIYGGLLLPHLT